MKIKQGTPFILCSGYDVHSNTDHTLNLISSVLDVGLQYKQVAGCYNGKEEKSLLVTGFTDRNDIKLAMLTSLLRDKYYQESYLYVDHNRDASLISLNWIRSESGKQLGKFVRAKLNDVSEYQAWTRDLKTGQYWVTDLAA